MSDKEITEVREANLEPEDWIMFQQIEVVDNATLDLVQRGLEILDEYSVPYVGYLTIHHEDGDIEDAEAFDFVMQIADAIETPCCPSAVESWLLHARETLQRDERPKHPRLASPDVDKDGHTWRRCLGCATTFRDDEEKSCSCPVGTATAPPPEDARGGLSS